MKMANLKNWIKAHPKKPIIIGAVVVIAVFGLIELLT